jgi:hypothetical protein
MLCEPRSLAAAVDVFAKSLLHIVVLSLELLCARLVARGVDWLGVAWRGVAWRRVLAAVFVLG